MTAEHAVQVATSATDGTSETPQSAVPERKKKQQQPRKNHRARVVPINKKVADKMAAEKMLPSLVDYATQPKQLPSASGEIFVQDKIIIAEGGRLLIASTNPLHAAPDYQINIAPTDPVKAHPYDIYRLIGEMVVHRFDETKIVKQAEIKTLWNYFRFKKEAPEMLSFEPFFYTMNRDAKPTPLKDVNLDAMPAVFAYEGAVAARFVEQDKFDCADLLTQVQKLHYQSHIGDDPKKPYRTLDFRGNDHQITGYNTHVMMGQIKDNGVVIGLQDESARKPKYVERLLNPEVKSMNQKDAFFIMAGFLFEKHVQDRVKAAQQNRLQIGPETA